MTRLAFVGVVVLIACAPTYGSEAPSAARRPAILGHRGALTHAPENTPAAFELCLLAGVDIELDVHATKDGQLVVLHDATVDRTTDGKGRVSDLTLDEIKRLDAGTWFHPDFVGERVPTLDEALAQVKAKERRPTTVAVNLKPINGTIIEGVTSAIREHDMFGRTFVFDLSLENAQRVKERDRRIRCAASCQTPEQIRDALKLDYIDVIWTGPRSKGTIDDVHAAGKQIYFTIVNDASQWLKVKADGADGICTNYPLEMKRAAWPPPADRDWDHYLEPDKRGNYRYKAQR